MRHLILALVSALSLMIAPASAQLWEDFPPDDAGRQMPKFLEESTPPTPSPVCHPFEYWNGTMQQLGGKLIFTGPNERGDIIVIMAFPDGSFGFFNVAIDGSTVCMIAAAGAATWDRGFLKSRVFGDDPGRSI
jgi:hypothetical protein